MGRYSAAQPHSPPAGFVGIGFTRPGFTAGASLAVGPQAQGSVAGKVTSVNGASFIFSPSIGVGLYEASHALPYLTAAAALVALFGYAWGALREPVKTPQYGEGDHEA